MSQKSLKFHIKSDDHFGTVATIVSLVRHLPQNIKQNAKALNRLEKDLMYLQKNYKIVKK